MMELNPMKQWVEESCQDPVGTWFLRVGEMTRDTGNQVVMLG